MPVSAKVEKLPEALVSFDVQVSKENVVKGFDLAYSKIANSVRVPGFRKGNVPKSLLKKRYGSSLKKEALENVVEDSVKEVAEKENIHLISNLQIEDFASAFDKITEGQDFSFKAMGEIYPEVVIGNYKDIKVTLPKYVFTDEHKGHRLKEMQYKLTSFIEKGEDGVIEDGDFLRLKLHFFASANEADTYREYYLNLKEDDTPFDEVKDKLLGMKRGSNIELNVGDIKYVSEELYSKYKKLSLEIVEIKGQDVPEVDDELAKDHNFDTLKSLEEDIEKNLENNCKQKSKDAFFDKLVSSIIDNSTFMIGKQAVELQVYSYLNRLEENLKKDNFSMEDYLKSMNKDIDGFKEECREKAVQDIKFELVKGAILKEGDIKVGEEDLDLHYKEYASSLNIPYEEAKKLLMASDKHHIFYDMLLYKKFVDFLIDNNTLEEDKEEPVYEIDKKDNIIS